MSDDSVEKTIEKILDSIPIYTIGYSTDSQLKTTLTITEIKNCGQA